MEFKEYILRKEVVKKENKKYNLDIDYRLVADESKFFKNYNEAYDYLIRIKEEFEKYIDEFNDTYKNASDELKNDIKYRIDSLYSGHETAYRYMKKYTKVERYAKTVERLNLYSFQKNNVEYNNSILEKEVDKIAKMRFEFLKECIEKFVKDDYETICKELKNNEKYKELGQKLIRIMAIITERKNVKKEKEAGRKKEEFFEKSSKAMRRSMQELKEKNELRKKKEKGKTENSKEYNYNRKLKSVLDETWDIKENNYNVYNDCKEELFDGMYNILKLENDVYDKTKYSTYFSYIYSDDLGDEKNLYDVIKVYNKNYKRIVEKISEFVEEKSLIECKKELGEDFSNRKGELDYGKYIDIFNINVDYRVNKTIVDDIYKYMKNIDERIYENLKKTINEDVIDIYNFGMKIQKSYNNLSQGSGPYFITVNSNMAGNLTYRNINAVNHEIGHSVSSKTAKGNSFKSTIISETFAEFFAKNFLYQLIKDEDYKYLRVTRYIYNELIMLKGVIRAFIIGKLINDELMENVETGKEYNKKGRSLIIEELSNKYMSKMKEVTNRDEQNIKLIKYDWLNSGFDKPYNEFHYALADIISINMLMKLEEDNNYNNKIYEAMEKSSDLNCYEILDILGISLTDDSTYDNILKYVDRLCEYITKVEKES